MRMKNPEATLLTPIEHEIVALIALGKSAKEIAASTSLALRTVERHIGYCRQKLGARNNAQLVAKAASTNGLSTSG